MAPEMADRKTRWVDAGEAARVCVMAEQVVAVIYWTEDRRDPKGNPQEAGWYLLHADAPQRHLPVGVHEKENPNLDLLYGEAGRMVLQRFDRRAGGED